MTTKADVLAARAEYERVAEAYLRERDFKPSDDPRYPWRTQKYAATWTLDGALCMAFDLEEPTA